MTDEAGTFDNDASLAPPPWEDGAEEEGGWSAHVLVVDDDAAMRHMITSYLEQQGLSVTSASQGQDAARQLAK